MANKIFNASLATGKLGCFEVLDLLKLKLRPFQMNEVFQELSLVNSSSLYSGHGGIIYSKAFFLAEENFRKQWLATVSLDLD
ncbi:MAG: hypothetical protein ACK5RO_00230, partial [Pseudobdellovibrionaceae bacterium]